MINTELKEYMNDTYKKDEKAFYRMTKMYLNPSKMIKESNFNNFLYYYALDNDMNLFFMYALADPLFLVKMNNDEEAMKKLYDYMDAAINFAEINKNAFSNPINLYKYMLAKKKCGEFYKRDYTDEKIKNFNPAFAEIVMDLLEEQINNKELVEKNKKELNSNKDLTNTRNRIEMIYLKDSLKK